MNVSCVLESQKLCYQSTERSLIKQQPYRLSNTRGRINETENSEKSAN